jgi:serine/threonine protein kinase
LSEAPSQIRDFKVVRGLNRGFYSAVFQVTQGALEVPYVLKVASKAIYAKFAAYGKNFEQECRLHRAVADGSEHLVPIRDMFEADITFGDITVPCHVAQMDYVEGDALENVLHAEPPPTARTVAQIALDLLQLLEELQAKEAFHNDLHEENVIVQRLPPTSRRAAEALDDSIRVVAIDLGSITEASKSGNTRLGDLGSVARFLESFANRLLVRPGETSDLDYRLAGQLQEIAALLASEAVNQRAPEFAVLRDRIRQAHDFVASPWKEPPPLRSIDDSYNAQTLHPWFVPKLLVDPDGHWREEISKRGPQLITGMRGCGKTMLLRALMFHARAAAHQETLLGEELAKGLTDDGYVGLYVSCSRLLDPLGSTDELHEPDARLFVAYVREALRALRHLRELDRSLPAFGAARRLGEVLRDYVANVGTMADTDDELLLERLTLRMLASLQRGESEHVLRTDPSVAFIALAEALKSASTIWSGVSVFYLLDDVSTRYLRQDSIRELVSRLIFSSDICAFKMTTEAQTLEYVLMSPGLIEKARPGRDYDVFEFGAQVYERIRAPLRKGGGTNFIRDILALRAAQYPAHPRNVTPADLLGNQQLEAIAKHIAALSATAAERKRVYHGLRALTAVCVGDIGDVLAIYDAMFRRGGAERVPISPEIQHQCFLDYCAQRLYHLNHRDGRFKDAALGFAQAARDLLVDSARKNGRLRQYSSIYVRVTTEDTEEQFEQLRTLIDAGVFVLEGGAPRTKTRDDDPVQQFILKYRKLFGLASLIGLADRDRFELSGNDLREWLAEPKRGRDILKRNLGGPLEEADEPEPPLDEADLAVAASNYGVPRPHTLFESAATTEEAEGSEGRVELASFRTPTSRELTVSELGALTLRSIVLGLGFEERTFVSTQRLLEVVHPEHAVLIRYDEKGYSQEIERIVRARVGSTEILDYRTLGPAADLLPPAGPCLVDVTGLAKPMIFQSVRRALSREGAVIVAHTKADRHYPLDEEIAPVLAAENSGDIWAFLEGLNGVWTGEAGPYTFEQLLRTDADESRRRYLIASASPKHQRLLSLVEHREFDRVQILAPVGDTPRAILARRAATVATRLADRSEVTPLDSDDLPQALREIAQAHQRYYVDGNYNFELGLTGSKLHAVAFAAVSATTMISQAWYVRPSAFDAERFSVGVGESRYFELSVPALW